MSRSTVSRSSAVTAWPLQYNEIKEQLIGQAKDMRPLYARRAPLQSALGKGVQTKKILAQRRKDPEKQNISRRDAEAQRGERNLSPFPPPLQFVQPLWLALQEVLAAGA